MSDPRRRNVLFILTDDQGPWALGCAGNEEIRTPNLDRLAADGMRFDRFFCTSPVCSPARASILTGRIPSQHGVHDWIRDPRQPDAPDYLEGQTLLTDVLARHGYRCGLSGKWHLGRHRQPRAGFSHWFCLLTGGSRYNDADMCRGGEVVRCPGYLTDVITDDALTFLDAAGDQPFYLSVHYNAPHSPWDGHPPEIVAGYDDCPFKSCPQEAMHPWANPQLRQHFGNRESLKGYFAAVTAMDRNAGRLVARLDERGLRDDTLIVFMSDNGFSCGHHGVWGKGNGTRPLNMYDNSVKVPCIVSHPPRVPAGRVSGAMLSQYDVLPTLLEYLGLPAVGDDTLPGSSFLPVLTGQADEARDALVVYDEYGPVRMIRTSEWKYVHRYPAGPHELYDLHADPDERRNLIDEPVRQPVVVELRRRLARWFERYVVPSTDGARCPVDGGGQIERIDADHVGEETFHGREF